MTKKPSRDADKGYKPSGAPQLSKNEYEYGSTIVDVLYEDIVVLMIGGQPRVFDTRARQFERAAELSGLSWRTVKSLFHKQIKNPSFEIVQKVKDAATRFKENKKRIGEEQERLAADELRKLNAELARVREALVLFDAHYRDKVDVQGQRSAQEHSAGDLPMGEAGDGTRFPAADEAERRR